MRSDLGEIKMEELLLGTDHSGQFFQSFLHLSIDLWLSKQY